MTNIKTLERQVARLKQKKAVALRTKQLKNEKFQLEHPALVRMGHGLASIGSTVGERTRNVFVNMGGALQKSMKKSGRRRTFGFGDI